MSCAVASQVEEIKSSVESAVASIVETPKKEEAKTEVPPPLPASPPPAEAPVEEKKEEAPPAASPAKEEPAPVPEPAVPEVEAAPAEVVGGGGESLAELEAPAVPAPVTNGLNGKHTPEEKDAEEMKDEILSCVTEKLESLKVSHEVESLSHHETSSEVAVSQD